MLSLVVGPLFLTISSPMTEFKQMYSSINEREGSCTLLEWIAVNTQYRVVKCEFFIIANGIELSKAIPNK